MHTLIHLIAHLDLKRSSNKFMCAIYWFNACFSNQLLLALISLMRDIIDLLCASVELMHASNQLTRVIWPPLNSSLFTCKLILPPLYIHKVKLKFIPSYIFTYTHMHQFPHAHIIYFMIKNIYISLNNMACSIEHTL